LKKEEFCETLALTSLVMEDLEMLPMGLMNWGTLGKLVILTLVSPLLSFFF
jgi:hypothetical protein